jgi:hypothetical protein
MTNSRRSLMTSATSRAKATKEQIVSLHGQVNAIETQLRGMQHTKLHARVADVEEKVFGRARD